MDNIMLGHNNPPSDADILSAKLADKEKYIRDQMIPSAPPSIIEDEGQAGLVTDAIKHIVVITKLVVDAHKSIKEPYLEGGKIVDSWKKRLEAELDERKAPYSKFLNEFLDRRASEERARIVEAARIERARSEALAAEAKAHEEAGISDTAVELLDAAIESEALADHIDAKAHMATPSQLAKSRSMYGATASQKLVWTGEIVNIAAIDFNALRSHFPTDAIQKAVNSFVRDGGRQLNGVKIEQKSQLNVR